MSSYLNGDMEKSVKIWHGENSDATDEDIAFMRERLGNSTAGIPESSQISALNAEWYILRKERRNSADDAALISPKQLERIEDAKLAFGKRGQDAPLKHRGEFLKKYGEVEFDIERKKWGVDLHSRSPGRNPYKGVVAAAEKAGKLPTNAGGAAKPGGTDTGKQSSNPWKMEPGPEATLAIVAFVGRMPASVSAGLAKAAGKTIDGRPLTR